MAGELVGAPGTSVATLKAILHAGGQVYDRVSAAFVPFVAGDWSRYIIDTTVRTGTGLYYGDWPASASAATHVTYHEGTTLGPAISWQLLKIGRMYAFPGTIGLTLRGVIQRNDQVWDRISEAWVTYASGDWLRYLITVDEFAGTGVYTAAVPTGAEAWTRISYHIGTMIGDAVSVQPRLTVAGFAVSPEVVCKEIPYTPDSQWCRPGRIVVCRGSGVPVKFIQNGTPVDVNAEDFEARLGVDGGSNPIRFNTTNGRLSYLGSGVLLADPTSEETESLPSDDVVFELWRIDDDKNKTIVGKSSVILTTSINP